MCSVWEQKPQSTSNHRLSQHDPVRMVWPRPGDAVAAVDYPRRVVEQERKTTGVAVVGINVNATIVTHQKAAESIGSLDRTCLAVVGIKQPFVVCLDKPAGGVAGL